MNLLKPENYHLLLESGLKIDSAWFEGDLNLLDSLPIAVIGTRKPTKIGMMRVEKTCKILIENGFTVVSGLAAGVDTAAHESAFKYSGRTIAVLPTPLDQCYPKENTALKNRIKESGLLLSQFEQGSKLFKSNFIQRNKLMAAISLMTIVIEASVKSGTRHQVEACIEMGRPVGFLSSLAENNYHWIENALKSGHGFIITDNSEFIRRLELLKP